MGGHEKAKRVEMKEKRERLVVVGGQDEVVARKWAMERQ